MVTSTTNIQTGMEVYSADGEKIGQVKEIYPNASPGAGQGGDTGAAGDVVVEEVVVAEIDPDGVVVAEVIPEDPMGAGAAYNTAGPGSAGTPPATGAGSSAPTGYIKVEHGGILGIGAKDLYIPVSAVTDISSADGRLTVSCRKDECLDQFGTKPDFLDRQDNGKNRS